MNTIRYLLILMLLLIFQQVFPQRYTISGYISDEQSSERLINANIYEKTSLAGTTANNYGFYSITLPKGEVTLVASFIGYGAKEFKLTLESNIQLDIQLKSTAGEIEEVTVVGRQINKVEDTQMSMVELSTQKLQKIPVMFGEADVLKVIQLLPGVQSGTEGTSGIYVRGGGPDQNLFLLDGVPVYNASHLLGFFSVFNPDAIKTVKLYKGGFPARFGGRLSSVVDITMKDGNMKKLSGNFSIGIISSKLSLEGPLIKDKTSFMVSARRTYLDLLSKPLFLYFNTVYDEKARGGAFFHDYNLKVNHIFNDRSRLYLSGYFGKDKGFAGSTYESNYLNSENQPRHMEYKDEFALGWGNTIASARWNYLLTPQLFSNTTVTYSRYIFDVGSEFISRDLIEKTKAQDVFRYYSGIEDIAAKIDFDYFPAPAHAIKFGSSYIHHHFTPGATRLKFESTDIDDEMYALDTLLGNRDIYAHELASYIEDDITVNSRLKINAGLYLSLFMVDDATYLRPQPRLSVRYKGGDNWALKTSYSRMAQHVHLLTTAGISMPTDLWLPVTEKFEPPISDQVALGTAINFPKGINLTLEGFYKTMNNLIEYKEGASFMGSATNWESKVEKGRGWAYGAEVMLEKTIGKTTGWIGYTWSKTERLFEELNFGEPFPAKYDRRHDISIAFTHQFSDRFDIGGTWVYGTGNAVTLAVMEYPSAPIPHSGYNYWYSNSIKEYDGRNNYRMPAYHRMDLGMNFHKEKKNGIRTWSISVYNAYNHQNPFMLLWQTNGGDYIYNPTTGEYIQESEPETVLTQFSLFPLIPSLSYSFKF
ncbi:TonB-dependent receptor [Roseimarinus sediminis]|uniref:TonB-dependent receptor n=1 Tax=Roseimarinus sediminis TaxID=1610899 RepID=UPI003D1C07A7